MGKVLDKIDSLPVISGPWVLFDGSMTMDFLKTDDSALNSSVIMRAVYKASHPLSRMGKNHPQAPPLHLHFDQFESFKVLTGSVGTTLGYEAQDRIFTPMDDTYVIKPWQPHRFWVDDNNRTEDSTLVIWVHPKNLPNVMDTQFFEALLRSLSDAHEQKKMPSLLQVMLLQHATASSLVVFPRAWWLGSLRWMVPYVFQAALAGLARLLGYKNLPYDEWKKTN